MSSRAMKQAIDTCIVLAVDQNRKYMVFLSSFEYLLFSHELLYKTGLIQCKVTIVVV